MSHLNTRTPSGDDVTQRSDMKPAFSSDLFEHVLQEDNLSAAWKRVRANKGAAGIDGMTIDEFPAWVRSGNWKALKQQLVTGCYQPSPVRRVEIAKPDGGTRQLGIPTVTDRVIQQAITQVLRHCCKVSDEAAFCLIQRPYISKTLLTRRISPRGSP